MPTCGPAGSVVARRRGASLCDRLPVARSSFVLVTALLLVALAALPASAYDVCIDPGHGGPFPGACNSSLGLREKDANLGIALALRDELVARGMGVDMTRRTDTALSTVDIPTWHWDDNGVWLYADGTTTYGGYVPIDDLQARCNVANHGGADVFVSIHNNGAANTSARGTETYATRADELSRDLAELVQYEVVREVGTRNRGVYEMNFYVVRWTNMPAILVECAYVSNYSDALMLSSAYWQRRFAEGIANGIERWLGSDPFRPMHPRLAGATRYGTSVEVSRAGWPSGADTVILAGGGAYADCLVAAPLSHELDAPVLLAGASGLAAGVADEIARVGPSGIVVIGGNSIVPSAVVTEALAAAGLSATAAQRLGGADRYETAALVAGRVGVAQACVAIASGQSLADAPTAAAWASKHSAPVLLVKKDSLSSATASFLAGPGAGVTSALVAGGPAVVSDAVVAQVPGATRVSGRDRYETNTRIVQYGWPSGDLKPVLASGRSYPDSLMASVYASKMGEPVVLTNGKKMPDRLREFLENNESRLKLWTIVGGTSVLPYVVDWEILKAAPYSPDLTDLNVYPNPVTPNGDGWADRTYFNYSLNAPARVSVKVYDITWRLMAVPVYDVSQQPGFHSVAYDARGLDGRTLPDGMYWYSVQAENSAGSQARGGLVFVSSGLAIAEPPLGTGPVLSGVWADPNPFSPDGDGVDDTGGVHFDLSSGAYVTVKVFDYMGEVRTLVLNERRPAGANWVYWDGRDDAGGPVDQGNYRYFVFATGGGSTPYTDLQTKVISVTR